MSTGCPCGSGRPLDGCCGPLLDGVTAAPTPEALMRSRYTAHVLHRIDYLLATWEHRGAVDRAAVERWARESTWLGLEIVRAGGDTVEFRARYRDGAGTTHVHHERSRFRRGADGRWLYVDGTMAPAARAAVPGRNDPCPCGSGRKHKRCCGAAT
jgi:SEC-C motif-containing protein